MRIFIGILIIFVFIGIIIWASKSMMEQSQKDWETLKYLEEKAEKIETLEELVEFHKEFVEKGNKIYNSLITPRLFKIDGFIRGMYKNLKK